MREPDDRLRGCPESIPPVVVMDSGLALRAPRNDENDFREFLRRPRVVLEIRSRNLQVRDEALVFALP